MRSTSSVLLGALAAILCVGISSAQTPVSALDFDHHREWTKSPTYNSADAYGFALDTYWERPSGDGVRKTQGWVFDVLEPVVLTHLGMYDASKDGLESSVVVGLWEQSSTKPLAVSVVAPDATLDGSWRTAKPMFANVQYDANDPLSIFGPGTVREVVEESILLQPGRYTIGAVYSSAPAAQLKEDLGNTLIGSIVTPVFHDEFNRRVAEGDLAGAIALDSAAGPYSLRYSLSRLRIDISLGGSHREVPIVSLDSVQVPAYDGVVEQFLWNLDIFSNGDIEKAMPDERLTMRQSLPLYSVFGQDDNIPGSAVLKKPLTGYLISGAMVGPTFFVVPQIPEPTSCILAGTSAVLLITHRRRTH